MWRHNFTLITLGESEALGAHAEHVGVTLFGFSSSYKGKECGGKGTNVWEVHSIHWCRLVCCFGSY